MNEFDLFKPVNGAVPQPERFHEEQQCSVPVAKGLPVVLRLFLSRKEKEHDQVRE